jgi:hypothetical protein
VQSILNLLHPFHSWFQNDRRPLSPFTLRTGTPRPSQSHQSA